MSKAATIAAFLLEDDELDSEFDAKGQAMQPELKPWELAVELGFSANVYPGLGRLKLYGTSDQFRLGIAVTWDAYKQWGSSRTFAEMLTRCKIFTVDTHTGGWTSYSDWIPTKLGRRLMAEFNPILADLDEQFTRIADGFREDGNAADMLTAAHRALVALERFNVNP